MGKRGPLPETPQWGEKGEDTKEPPGSSHSSHPKMIREGGYARSPQGPGGEGGEESLKGSGHNLPDQRSSRWANAGPEIPKLG